MGFRMARFDTYGLAQRAGCGGVLAQYAQRCAQGI